jgi:hypothetical protein
MPDNIEELLQWQVVGDWAFAFNDIVYNDGSDVPTQRKIYWRNGNMRVQSKSIFSKRGREMLWFYLSLVVPMMNIPPLTNILTL